MFNKLVKKLFNVLFASESLAAENKKKSYSGKNKRSRKPDKRLNSPQKKTKERKNNDFPAKVSPAAIKPAVRPPRPEKLREVAVLEGTMRFLELDFSMCE